MRNLIVVFLAGILVFGCVSEPKKQQRKEDQPRNTKVGDVLLASRWYVLLKSPGEETQKYIEPSCLSTTAFLEFKGENTPEEIIIGCGQDAIPYNIVSIDEKESSFGIVFDKNGVETTFKVVYNETSEKYPFPQLKVSIANIDELLLGYYPETLLKVNSGEILYVIDTQETSDFLKANALYDKLPCEEEMEE